MDKIVLTRATSPAPTAPESVSSSVPRFRDCLVLFPPLQRQQTRVDAPLLLHQLLVRPTLTRGAYAGLVRRQLEALSGSAASLTASLE